jgi:Co/Zn/Cd efflux system component
MNVSGNAKTLIVTAFLFASITSVQYVASLPKFANSLALRADCLSMAVDTCSYLGNLAAECNSNQDSKKAMELIVAGISLSVLLGFTVAFFVEAVQLAFVSSTHNSAQSSDVNPKIGTIFIFIFNTHPDSLLGCSPILCFVGSSL